MRLQSSNEETTWHVRPTEPMWPTGPVAVRYIVLPQYVAGARTALRPIRRSAAFLRLVEQSQRMRRLGYAGVKGAVELVRAADCYELTTGALGAAVDAVRQLVTA